MLLCFLFADISRSIAVCRWLPNMKAQYMMLVGQLEHRVHELKTEVNRWKRRFALRQQYLNRGEKPDFMGIEAELDKEFAEYLAEILARHLTN